jgi:RNA ligase
MPVYLKDVLPLELLDEHLRNGIIRKQVHPLFSELSVYNYSEKAQFDRIWDACTNVCRGLVAAGDEVIARGFNKFHNLNTEYVPETLEANLPMDMPPLVTKKLDGSMGIAYRWDSQWWVATRGSFDSDQARWATAWLRSHCSALGLEPGTCWLGGYTPVFEIIYQQNRIVVDYHHEGLVMLGVIEISTGRELPRSQMEDLAQLFGLQPVEKFDKTLAECAAEDIPNEEGYVLTYSNGVKIKVKFAEYVRLHRILTGLNPKAIWELLAEKAGASVDLLLQDDKMPSGFKAWLREWATELRGRYATLEKEALNVFAGRPKFDDFGRDLGPALRRKMTALYFQKTPHLASILFAMLDGKDHAEIIWDRVRPKATDTFKHEGD